MSQKKSNTISGDLYFLADLTDNNNPLFSSLFHRIGDLTDENNIELQMLRDLDWSFKLPSKTVKHVLYKYTSGGYKTMTQHKCDIFSQFSNGEREKFTVIAEFFIDPNSSAFDNLRSKLDEIKRDNPATRSIPNSVHHELINLESSLNQHQSTITYDAHVYTEGSNVSTLICLPNVSIQRL